MSDAKEKRKHGGDVAFSGSQKKTREEGTTAVTDEEVEEFYTILRRINTAVKYFKNGRDDVAALDKKIMQEVKGASGSSKEENLRFDLNVAPQPQPE